MYTNKIKKITEFKELLNVISKYILADDVSFKKDDFEIAEKLVYNAKKEISIFKKKDNHKKLRKILNQSKQDYVFMDSYGIHHRDFDEMSYSIGGHPTATILPVLSAYNLEHKRDYFLQALKLEIILGKLFNPGLYNTKYHPTTIIGTLGSTAISAKILNLSHKQTVNALGIALSFFAGIKGNFGSDAKSLQVANATKSGLLSALFSQAGFSPNLDLLEQTNSLELFISKKIKNKDIQKFKELSSNSLILKDEFLFKKYDVCGSFHNIIELAMQDKKIHQKQTSSIEKITLHIHSKRLQDKNILLPHNSAEKKFSPRYLYAYSFLGKDIDQITGTGSISKDVLRFMEKIKIFPDNSIGEWKYKTVLKKAN